MKEIQLPDGVVPLELIVDKLSRERITEDIPGMLGPVDYGYSYRQRGVRLKFLAHGKDETDKHLLEEQLSAFFDDYDEFLVARSLVPSRVLRVHVNEVSDPERFNVVDSLYTVSGQTMQLPFWTSLYTTKELNDTGYSALVEKYGLVDGINSDNTKYKFTERNFSVWNAGNVTVEPETMYLKITSTGTNGKLEIRNKTTGQIFKVDADFGGDLVIDGMSTQLKGTNVFRDTNKRYISLASGKNEFEVIGQFTDITIDFRFYYK